jgi:hypothetical protein
MSETSENVTIPLNNPRSPNSSNSLNHSNNLGKLKREEERDYNKNSGDIGSIVSKKTGDVGSYV